MTILALALVLAQAAGPTEKEADAAIAAFKTAYKSDDVIKRGQAVTALGQCEHLKVLSVLSPLLGREEGVVRLAAIEALAGWTSHQAEAGKLLLPVLRQEPASPPDEVLFEGLLKAIVKLRVKAAAGDLHRLMIPMTEKRTRMVIDAVGDLRSRESIDPLLKLWQDDEHETEPKRPKPGDTNSVIRSQQRPDVIRAQFLADRSKWIQNALQTITGQIFADSKEGLAWWRQNKATFKDP